MEINYCGNSRLYFADSSLGTYFSIGSRWLRSNLLFSDLLLRRRRRLQLNDFNTQRDLVSAWEREDDDGDDREEDLARRLTQYSSYTMCSSSSDPIFFSSADWLSKSRHESAVPDPGSKDGGGVKAFELWF